MLGMKLLIHGARIKCLRPAAFLPVVGRRSREAWSEALALALRIYRHFPEGEGAMPEII